MAQEPTTRLVLVVWVELLLEGAMGDARTAVLRGGFFFLAFFFFGRLFVFEKGEMNECATLTGYCCERQSPCGDFVEHFWTMYTESLDIWIRRNWKNILV